MSTAPGPVPSRGPRSPRPAPPTRAPLRVVAPGPGPTQRARFTVALVLLLGAGLVGLLLLNTAMQRRAFTLTSLDQQADALDVEAAALTMRTERLASTQRLAQQAAELGMVPNTNPVFLRLSDGQVVGDPVPASSAAAIPGLLPTPPTVKEPQRRPGADSSPGAVPPSAGDDAPTGGRKPHQPAGATEDGPRSHDRAASQSGGQGDTQGDQ